VASDDIVELAGTVPATQLDAYFVKQSIRFIRLLPKKHQEVLFLLLDGANPLEISNETGTAILTTVKVIREARSWLAEGGCYLGDVTAKSARTWPARGSQSDPRDEVCT